jgi:hypothetical protein
MGGNITSSEELRHLLDTRKWLFADEPFPHITANDVFRQDYYGRLSWDFRQILSRPGGPNGFTRGIKGYDASGFSFSPDQDGPLSIFISRAWHDLIANAVGISATGHINSGLHHHAIGSKNGRVHNDLNPAWFVDYENPEGIRVSRHELCNYKTGVVYDPNVSAVEIVRAVAVIYYLANSPWQPGEGGETGLYLNVDTPVESPAKKIPPLNNSLVIFECTPYSFHSFISNRRSQRNSMIMWLHRPKSDVVRRWGDQSIVYWPKA